MLNQLVSADPLLLPGLAIGLAVLLGAAALSQRLAARLRREQLQGVGRVREPAPPAWRLVWSLLRLIGFLADPLLPLAWRRRSEAQLREAGLDLALSARDVFAARLLCALLGLLLAWLLLRPATGLWVVFVSAAVGFWLPAARLQDQVLRRRRRITRDLPIMLDLVTMAVQGGTTVSAAIAMAVQQGPAGPLRDELGRVLREVRAGRQRHVALRAMSDRYPISGLRHAVGAIISAERQGADLSGVLRGQSEQRRHERFLEAERLAMQAPVKMLLPLVLFVFPGTFLILMFPVAVQLMGSGLL